MTTVLNHFKFAYNSVIIISKSKLSWTSFVYKLYSSHNQAFVTCTAQNPAFCSNVVVVPND